MYNLIFLALAALLCQVQSQQCNCPNIPAPNLPVNKPTPILPIPTGNPTNLCQSPVVVPPTLISTTIVDNSIANSLANALQLLIVSQLIDNTINAPIYASPYLPTLCDAVQSIGTVDIVSPVVDIALAPIDIVPINHGPVVDVSSTVVTEVITPAIPNIASTIITETVSTPIVHTPGVIGFPEMISPGIYNPNIYAPVTEIITPLAPEIIAPSVDIFTSITEVVNPVVSVAPPVYHNPYYGIPEVVSPFTQGYVTEVTEIVGPREIIPVPPYYGGYTEVFNSIQPGRPFAAEVIFPPSIPAQLKCNFGYAPSSVPIVNVETVPLVEPGSYPFYY